MSNENQPILKCKTCRYCAGGGAGSSRGRYGCEHPVAAKSACASTKLICYVPRRSEEFTIKRTPKWCPLEMGDKVKIGDKVVMNDKYYVSEKNKGRVWTVCSEPWDCCGTSVVLLEGFRGGYAVDGLDIIEEAQSDTHS